MKERHAVRFSRQRTGYEVSCPCGWRAITKGAWRNALSKARTHLRALAARPTST